MTKATKRLFEAYPASDYDNPKAALAQMVTVLSGYSLGIVRYVTSPENGLQRTCKFPPRIAEIVEACEKAADRINRFDRMRMFGQQRLIERDLGPKLTREELLARYGGSLLPADFGTKPLPNEISVPASQAAAYMEGIRARIAHHKEAAAKRAADDEARSIEEHYRG